MSKFIEMFSAARRVSTPCIAVRTPDAASTIANIRKAIVVGKSASEAEKELDNTPFVSWDAIHGLRGINKKGAAEVAEMSAKADIAVAASAALPVALAMAEFAKTDVILFVHNAHMFWDTDKDPLVVQGIWNLRDKYKANGNMIVLLVALGAAVPSELNNDTLLLEEPLPTRAEIRDIVVQTFKAAGVKQAPSEETLTLSADALVGIASFPSDQATAMNLNMQTGELNIPGMWARKKDIIGATAGLSFMDTLTLADAGGLHNIKQYLVRVMNGKRGANIILRLDEIEKAFAGAGTDTSGVKGDLLGNFLSWVEDKGIICILGVGVPGASKSHIIACIGGEFKKPVINFDISGMQDMHVGNSGKNLRAACSTVEAISDGQIILIATANSLTNLPAELISRFEKGGIFFFDAPTAEERAEILALKIKKYKLTKAQTAEVPPMDGWTGREIDSMCNNADMLNLTLVEAGKYVVPLTKSHSKTITALRQSAHNRYLSASHEGLYQYKPSESEQKEIDEQANGHVHMPTVETSGGRKMRG